MNAPDPFALPVSRHELARLEETLRRVVLREEPLLNELSTHLMSAGGKRLRPALTLAVASLNEPIASEETLLGAVSVELVHLASLYHDDVMDEATRRRNVVSVNARWGNLLAIVAGDFLLARSAEIAGSLGAEIAQLIASTLADLCEGQVAEVRSSYQRDRTEEDYLSAISNKTAALMATACRMGGLTAGLPRDVVDSLTHYGRCIGMVFQIRDDVLDVLASEQELGKPPGQDLAEGVYTLPVQRALLEPGVGRELSVLLGRPLDETDVERARTLVSSSTGIAYAIAVARRYANEAESASVLFGEGTVAASLGGLGSNLLDDLERSTRVLAS